MFGCDCFYWNQQQPVDLVSTLPEPRPFSLPAPLPQWPQGEGFGTGRMNLGELEVLQVTKFQSAWRCIQLGGKTEQLGGGVSFYKPFGIPDGFHSLGYYCHPNDQQPFRGYVLVARQINHSDQSSNPPPLTKPINYSLIWSTGSHYDDNGYFWLPNPPTGYKAMGIVVTRDPDQPDVDEVRCVRADLTEHCETCDLVFSMASSNQQQFQIWTTKPCAMGMFGRGVSVGTFYCRSAVMSSEEALTSVACLKNLDTSLTAMPNLNQVHSLIQHYGPKMYFHPDDDYLPSSVQWFFKNGALLYKDGWKKGQPIDCTGSNLPSGGVNDGEYWIDLPLDDHGESNTRTKNGDLESAEFYVHVKPALGGSFTDIAMWVFCPFNGPVTLKIGLINIPMSRLGQHVGDWEHVTVRISNFTGELWQVFYSEHSGGRWVDASEVEFVEGSNKPIVYSSKHGHASFPHEGLFLQGATKLGVGVRNDTARSDYFIDSSVKYQVIAAEYLGEEGVKEPRWLQYMREWGPTVVYDSRSEMEKIINLLPFFVRFSVENLMELFPTELYGEEGPTGPKEKGNWVGDEIC